MGVDYVPTRDPDDNFFKRSIVKFVSLIDNPVEWFREKVVEPNRKEYYWYHRQYRRVPTVDQCYSDDLVCDFEAEQQFKRDKRVDSSILWILRRRFEECALYHSPNHKPYCQPIFDTYNQALENWFIKYGDLGGYGTCRDALMKQKHRMVWERRYGPVGTGNIPLEEREKQVQEGN